jgi:heterodisulfide reductase subunit A-like polyferredoxin
MIQCVRPDGVKEYCSRVCCTNTLKNAIRLKLTNPERRVTVLYKDIVTYGFREDYYTEARRLGVLFMRYDDESRPALRMNGASLSIAVRDPALGQWLELQPDLVILSMAIAPSQGTLALARMLRVPLSSEGFFQEAQMKLRPMDFQRDGIFLAGMAAYPKFIEESISHALAAAARAVTLLAQGSLHLGGVVAQVDPDKCVGCLTCTRTCPFGIPVVLSPTGAFEAGIAGASSEAVLTAIPSRHRGGRMGVGGLGGAAFIDPAQCQGCGTCTGECPANAIQLAHYSDEQVMLHGVHGLGSWQPEVVAN